MKIFFDLGAHLGESIDAFLEKFPAASEYEIYAFEPLPSSYVQLLERQTHTAWERVRLFPWAVSDHNGSIELYPARRGAAQGSTMMVGKKTGKIDYDKPIDVQCVDISTMISGLSYGASSVIVKCNIEGGEYVVVEKMMKEATLCHIDELYIQWHSHKFRGERRERYKDIERRFRSDADKYDTKLNENYQVEISPVL